jgi:DNA-directed RNA polymerase subunit H (RpoH/RPB5)
MSDIVSLSNPVLNEEEKMNQVLKHTVEMLIERRWINKENEKKTIERAIKDVGDGRDEIKLKCDRERKFVFLFIAYDGSKTKKKHIYDLVKKGDNHVIIISDDMKPEKDLRDIMNVEVFLNTELMRNIVRHILQPKFRVLDKEERDNFLKESRIKLNHLPKIIKGRPIPKYFNMKPGDVIEIIRPSEVTINEPPFYRVCMPDPDKC